MRHWPRASQPPQNADGHLGERGSGDTVRRSPGPCFQAGGGGPRRGVTGGTLREPARHPCPHSHEEEQRLSRVSSGVKWGPGAEAQELPRGLTVIGGGAGIPSRGQALLQRKSRERELGFGEGISFSRPQCPDSRSFEHTGVAPGGLAHGISVRVVQHWCQSRNWYLCSGRNSLVARLAGPGQRIPEVLKSLSVLRGSSRGVDSRWCWPWSYGDACPGTQSVTGAGRLVVAFDALERP